MKYRVGFKNGMTITIEAESLFAASHTQINFVTGEKADKNTYLLSPEVLFIAPAEASRVECEAAASSVATK